MKPEELKQYEIEPDSELEEFRYMGDGYDFMELVTPLGWQPLSGWRGHELGDWPFVLVFKRRLGRFFQIIEYIERDITVYQCLSQEIRDQIIDCLQSIHN